MRAKLQAMTANAFSEACPKFNVMGLHKYFSETLCPLLEEAAKEGRETYDLVFIQSGFSTEEPRANTGLSDILVCYEYKTVTWLPNLPKAWIEWWQTCMEAAPLRKNPKIMDTHYASMADAAIGILNIIILEWKAFDSTVQVDLVIVDELKNSHRDDKDVYERFYTLRFSWAK